MTKPDGGPAYPKSSVASNRGDGMSLRDYACIELRIPDTNHEWLNELIKTAKRDELAAKAFERLVEAHIHSTLGCLTRNDIARESYLYADAMPQAGEK